MFHAGLRILQTPSIREIQSLPPGPLSTWSPVLTKVADVVTVVVAVDPGGDSGDCGDK